MLHAHDLKTSLLGPLLSLGLLLSACAGGPVPPTANPAASDITPAQQQWLAQALEQNLTGATTLLDQPLRTEAPGASTLRSSALNGCASVSRGPDANGNGLPDSASLSLNCSASSARGSTSVTGSVQFSDTSASGRLSLGLSFTDLLFSAQRTGGGSVQARTSGSASLSQPSSTGLEASVQSQGKVTLNLPRLALSGQGTSAAQSSLSFVSSAGPLKLGVPLPAGQITLSAGRITLTVDGETLNVSLATARPVSGQLTPLLYDPACSDTLKLVGGSLYASLSGARRGVVSVTFNACGNDPSVVALL